MRKRATGEWKLTARVACLQHIQSSPHVALAQLYQALHRLLLDRHVLLLDDLVHQDPNIFRGQRAEAEARAPRQQRRAQLVRVVGDDAEARVGRVSLHDAAQRHLRGRRHGVGLVQDDQLEAGQARAAAAAGPGARARARAAGRPRGGREDLPRAGEGLDLLAHHVDAAVVAGVELEHHLPHVARPVDLARQREDGRRLARAGRAVEEEMREPLRTGAGSVAYWGKRGVGPDCTFESMNLLMVVRMSW